MSSSYQSPDTPSPKAPLRVVHGIIDALRNDVSYLKKCSQVARSWHSRSRQWLFTTVVIKSLDFRFDIVHALSPDLPPAGSYARTLHLVQCPFMWMQPSLLVYVSPHFSIFTNVTSLAIDALSIYLFTQAELRKAFGHFFQTVTELNLESPESHPHDLIAFLRHFSGLESLTISDPVWVEARRFLIHPRKAPSPFKGRLDLIRLDSQSGPFVRLLSTLPLGFRELSIIGCSLEGSEFDLLLYRLGQNLRSLAVSAWFEGSKFPPIRAAHCTELEELRFFAGMFPSGEMPFPQIYTTLDSVPSTHVKKVVLDLNVDGAPGLNADSFLVGVEGLDRRLCRVAELSAGKIRHDVFTVVLSTLDPSHCAERLRCVRQLGMLTLGTRYRGSGLCGGEIVWLGGDGCTGQHA